jgi:hypothetical protein
MSIAKIRLIHRISIVLLLGISGISLPYSATAVPDGPKLLAKQKSSLQIGKIQQNVEGAGCYFSYPNNDSETIFHSGGEGTIINIDGQDIQLKRVKTKTVGKRTIDTYSSGNIVVTVDLLQLKQLEGGSTYKVVMSVQRGSRKNVVKLVGGCGC